MMEYKHIFVDFPDEKDVEVLSFKISGTYSGGLEGSCRSASISKICDLLAKAKEEGFYFHLTKDQLVADEPMNMSRHWEEREKERKRCI